MTLLTDAEWESFKRNYGKSYADAAEDAMRRELVAKSKQFVDDHNKRYKAGEFAFTCGLNEFSDATKDERSRRVGCRVKPKVRLAPKPE